MCHLIPNPTEYVGSHWIEPRFGKQEVQAQMGHAKRKAED